MCSLDSELFSSTFQWSLLVNDLWSIYSSEGSNQTTKNHWEAYMHKKRCYSGQGDTEKRTALFLPKEEWNLWPLSFLGHGEFKDNFLENHKCSEVVGKILSVWLHLNHKRVLFFLHPQPPLQQVASQKVHNLIGKSSWQGHFTITVQQTSIVKWIILA